LPSIPKLTKEKKITLDSFPDGDSFHPHGLFLEQSNPPRLHVVNHAYSNGGERIDVFKVLGSGYKDVHVQYFQSIKPQLFSKLTGILNDLVVIEPGKLYVTQYRAFPDMLDGRDFHSNQTLGKFYGVLNTISFFSGMKNSPSWFCSYDSNHPGETDANCFSASPALWMSNGIIEDNDGYIYIVNPPNKEVVVHKRDRQSNSLVPEAVIKTPRAIDNLVLDKENGKLYGGALTISNFLDFVMEVAKTKSKPKNIVIPGGAIEITIEKDTHGNRTYKAEEILYMPGTKLSGISVAAKADNKILFGSWYDKGIVICPFPKK